MRFFLYATVSTMVLVSTHYPACSYNFEKETRAEEDAPSDQARSIEREQEGSNPKELDLTKVHDPESPDNNKRIASEKRIADVNVYRVMDSIKDTDNMSRFKRAMVVVSDMRPEVQKAVLVDLKEKASSLRPGKEKQDITRELNAWGHTLNVPVVKAKSSRSSATDIASQLVTGHPLADKNIMKRVDAAVAEVSGQLGNPKNIEYYTAFYKALREKAENEIPEVRVKILERGSQMLQEGPMKKGAGPGRKPEKLYSLASSKVVWTEANPRTQKQVIESFYGRHDAAQTEEMYLHQLPPKSKADMKQTSKEIKSLKKSSYAHARITHQTALEGAEHMSSVIGAMEAHLNENHDGQHIETLNAIKEAHERIRKDLTDSSKDRSVFGPDATKKAFVTLGAAQKHIFDLPDDLGGEGHKEQLKLQHEEVLKALVNHGHVISNHVDEHLSDKEREQLKTMKAAPKKDSSRDTSSNSSGTESDHSSSPPTPEHHSGEVHHDAPVHGATPHEAHVTPEHHSSGH